MNWTSTVPISSHSGPITASYWPSWIPVCTTLWASYKLASTGPFWRSTLIRYWANMLMFGGKWLRHGGSTGTVRYADVSFLRTVFIPKGFYSERSFLWTEFSPLIWKAYNLKGHCSENFNSEMPLFQTILIRKVFILNGFYPERFLIRTVLKLKGRFSEIRNKNLSCQKPFGSKKLYVDKLTMDSWNWRVIIMDFTNCHGCLR